MCAVGSPSNHLAKRLKDSANIAGLQNTRKSPAFGIRSGKPKKAKTSRPESSVRNPPVLSNAEIFSCVEALLIMSTGRLVTNVPFLK
jgi:hypothetical protein